MEYMADFGSREVFGGRRLSTTEQCVPIEIASANLEREDFEADRSGLADVKDVRQLRTISA